MPATFCRRIATSRSKEALLLSPTSFDTSCCSIKGGGGLIPTYFVAGDKCRPVHIIGRRSNPDESMGRFFGSRLGILYVGNFCVLARNEAKAPWFGAGSALTYLPRCFPAKNRLAWPARPTTYTRFTFLKPTLSGYRSFAIRLKCEHATQPSYISGFPCFTEWELIRVTTYPAVAFCTAWRATRYHALMKIYLPAVKAYNFIWLGIRKISHCPVANQIY